MERRLAVHAGAYRQVAALAAVVLAAAAPAIAAPKQANAKAAFDRGVKAYQDGDFAGASAALADSFALEADAETLFAWAQAERKLEHCDKAIELWTKLETFDLPKENRVAVDKKIDECKDVLAKQAPPPPPPEPDHTEPPPVEPDPVAPPPPPPHDTGAPSRWKSPIGLAMIGLGVGGLATGTVFMLQARSADKAKDTATSYDEFVKAKDRAESRGKLGTIALAAGGAFVVGGIVWIMTRPSGEHPLPVTGWIDGDGGGLSITGGF